MSLSVHIERIVVDRTGLTPRDRRALHDAVERELAERLRAHAASAWPRRGANLARVAGGSVDARAGGVGAVGARIAGAIDGALAQARGRP